MEKENSNGGGKYSGFFSKKLKAGKRRTYFFDVRSTKQGDFFLTITESKKKFEGEGYESHKIFLYKEDFKKFVEALNETVDYIKTELMPDYDYDSERTIKASAEPQITSKPDGEGKLDGHKEIEPTTSEATGSATQQISDDEQIDWN